MPSINLNDLNNAKADVDHIAAIATSTALSAVDRLGRSKLTMQGLMNNVTLATDVVMAGIGYSPPVPYVSGLSMALRTQTVEYAGNTYAPKLVDLPFVTSGTFEAAKFRLIQGVAIGDLAAPTGASLIGGAGQVVSSIVALRSLSKFSASKQAMVTGYYVGGDGGGGPYVLDPADTTSVDNGGTLIVAVDGGRWTYCGYGLVSVKVFGAKGDYKHDDSDAIQACLNYCGGDNGKCAYFPSGNYVISRPIEVPYFCAMRGDGPSNSRINLQDKPYKGDVFVNPAGFSTWAFMTVKDMAIRGGACAFHSTAGSQEQWTFTNVSMELQTVAGIKVARDWQINSFHNVQFYGCLDGIWVQAGFANHNNYYGVQFLGINGTSIRQLGSSEGNNFYGCRFEAGGLNGNNTIYATNNRNMNFFGGYFENTHNNLLVETNAHGTLFHGVHFTGALDGNTPYVFTSDGEVQFGPNTWFTRSDGPAKIRITGDNGGMLGDNNTEVVQGSRNHGYVVSPWVPCPGTLQKNLVVVSKEQQSGALTCIQSLTGILTIQYVGVESGGFGRQYSRKYHVSIFTIGFGTIGCNITLASSADPSGTSLVVRPKAGATGASITIEAVFTGMTPATQASSALHYSFEYDAMSTTIADSFTVNLA